MLAGNKEHGIPKNNLKEQLALHNSKKMLTTPLSKTTNGEKR